MTVTQKAALRSFLTTLLVTFLASIPVASVVDGDFAWLAPAAFAAVVAAVRTVIAALDPGNLSFGRVNDTAVEPVTPSADISE